MPNEKDTALSMYIKVQGLESIEPKKSSDDGVATVKYLSEREVEKLIEKWQRRNRLKKRLVIGMCVAILIIMLLAIGLLLTIVVLQAKQTCVCPGQTTISNTTYRSRTNNYSTINGTSVDNSTFINMVASPYSDCGSLGGSITAFFTENCVIAENRCRYDRYSTGRLDLTFTLKRPTQRLRVVAYGVADPVPFLEVVQNVVPTDACQSLPCPLQADVPYSILLTQSPPKETMFLIKSLSEVKTRVRYQLIDDNGSTAICLLLFIVLI